MNINVHWCDAVNWWIKQRAVCYDIKYFWIVFVDFYIGLVRSGGFKGGRPPYWPNAS